LRGEGRRLGGALVRLPARGGGHGKQQCMARQCRSSGWRWLGREVGDDARGGPIGPECWVQRKNGPKDLMGHPARGGSRWARPEK
jgi:hypothetical protein